MMDFTNHLLLTQVDPDTGSDTGTLKIRASSGDMKVLQDYLATANPGEYQILRVLRPKVVVEPPPERTRNKVDMGASTITREHKPKAEKQPEEPSTTGEANAGKAGGRRKLLGL